MSLYAWTAEHFAACRNEGERDVRHLGRYLTFAYDCPRCGLTEVTLSPDYPYAGASTTWTCKLCASVMRLVSALPIRGIPKSVTLESIITTSI